MTAVVELCQQQVVTTRRLDGVRDAREAGEGTRQERAGRRRSARAPDGISALRELPENVAAVVELGRERDVRRWSCERWTEIQGAAADIAAKGPREHQVARRIKRRTALRHAGVEPPLVLQRAGVIEYRGEARIPRNHVRCPVARYRNCASGIDCERQRLSEGEAPPGRVESRGPDRAPRRVELRYEDRACDRTLA